MSALLANISMRRSESFKLEVNCHMPAGTTTAIYGPSGCGKTSLLYCLAGLIAGDQNSTIKFGDEVWQQENTIMPTHQRGIGFVFQDARLFPHLDTLGNLRYGERRSHQPDGPSLEQVCQWLKLDDLLELYPRELSAGQQQRVAIGRALINHPEILFMDEPLANLDQSSRKEILQLLQQLQGETDIPMVYVSHDMEEVARLANWMVVMDAGSVVAEGPTLELSSHLELALAHEEQAAAILHANVTGQDPEFGLTQLEVDGHPLYVTSTANAADSNIKLRIPARDVSLCLSPPTDTSILNILPVKVIEIESGDNNRLLVRLQIGRQFLLARLTRKSIVSLGLKIGSSAFAQIKSVALLHD